MATEASRAPGVIRRASDVERDLAAGNLPEWAARAYGELEAKVRDEAFPCTFATVAQRKGDILYALLDAVNDAELLPMLRAALVEFTDLLRPLSPVTASMTPLAILVPPLAGALTEADYFRRGWGMLQWLHEHDTHDWPARVPRHPDDPGWSFCFGGMPLFINFKTPAHERRRSRRMRSAFMLLIQARDGFDVVAGDTPQGRRAREIIRAKLAAYDPLPPYPELAHYGQAENREWKQYFVPDENAPISARCPFHAVEVVTRGVPLPNEGG